MSNDAQPLPRDSTERAEPERIRVAISADDYQAFARLISTYLAWSRERYRDDPAFVDRVFGHQSLDTELQMLSTTYGPPNGQTLVAEIGDGESETAEIVGAVAYRRLADGSAEMKRLFVDPHHAGRGTGRRLCAAIIERARADGCRTMRLDTGQRMTEAIAMYRSFGFIDCPPHRPYPAELMRELVFLQLAL